MDLGQRATRSPIVAALLKGVEYGVPKRDELGNVQGHARERPMRVANADDAVKPVGHLRADLISFRSRLVRTSLSCVAIESSLLQH